MRTPNRNKVTKPDCTPTYMGNNNCKNIHIHVRVIYV